MSPVFEKSQRIRFTKKPADEKFAQHYDLALEYIDRGKVYTVEHFFEGDPAQVELVGIDTILFMTEMFEVVE
jgi:hypothetical protein